MPTVNKKVDRAKLVSMVKDRFSVKEIAAAMGVTARCVYGHMWRMGFNRNTLPEIRGAPRVSDRDKRFIQSFMEGSTRKEAAIEAFGSSSPERAAKDVGNAMQRVGVREAIIDIVERKIPREHRVDVLLSLLNHPDPTIQVRAFQETCKISGDYAAERVEVSKMDYAEVLKALTAAKMELRKLDQDSKPGTTPFESGTEKEWQKNGKMGILLDSGDVVDVEPTEPPTATKRCEPEYTIPVVIDNLPK
jgi:hypothetical protein